MLALGSSTGSSRTGTPEDIDRVAGYKPPCANGMRAGIPNHFPDDSTFLVADPEEETIYYRRQAAVQFCSTTSDAAVAEFLAKFQAQVVGGDPATGTYFIRFPDPGPSWAQLATLIERMNAYPGVSVAEGIPAAEPEESD
jgi:hypothetical protein